MSIEVTVSFDETTSGNKVMRTWTLPGLDRIPGSSL
jgi:hypothetical protein